MSHDDKTVTVAGEVTDVFAHRFVLRTADGKLLADLGPEGAAAISIAVGDTVTLTGRRKPSELKVETVERGGETVAIGGADKHEDPREPADPAAARAAVEKLGHTVVAEPHRKPKHFDVLAQDRQGRHHEHHVTLDGKVKKTKDGDPDHAKWRPGPPAAA